MNCPNLLLYLGRVCSLVKHLPAIAGATGDASLIPGLGRWEDSHGGGNGNLLQCSCLGNHMDRGSWQPTVYGVAEESDMTEHTYTCTLR